MSTEATQRIRLSILDGIALAPRFQERNLSALHSSIETAREAIIAAIEQDTRATREEALYQYLLTLDAIKTFHGTVHPLQCKEIEYRIARSQDHPSQRRAHGYAYISVSAHDELYGPTVATAAALAAGNCVLVQRPAKAGKVFSILEQCFTRSLSSEAFALVSQDPFEPAFRKSFRAPVMTDDGLMADASKVAQCVAVVDRTANLQAAAQDCVRARFGFGGKSAYAPDLVLVNEFCVRDFTSAVGEVALRYLVGSSTKSESKQSEHETDPELSALLDNSGTVLASGDRGKVVLVHKCDLALLRNRLNAPVLIIAPITSMDAAIDYLNTTNAVQSALYIYSSPDFAKYMSQFARTALTIVNHIPPALLVGPQGPLSHPPSIHPRLTPEMFSFPTPMLIEQSSKLRKTTAAIWPSLSGSKGVSLDHMVDTKLTSVAEPFGPPIGFFEQGILVGASLVLSSTIICLVGSFKYGYPALVARFGF